MYKIKVVSINSYKEVEWKEIVESGTKAGARRKANNVIRSCGLDNPKVEKRSIDSTYEYWTI